MKTYSYTNYIPNPIKSVQKAVLTDTQYQSMSESNPTHTPITSMSIQISVLIHSVVTLIRVLNPMISVQISVLASTLFRDNC